MGDLYQSRPLENDPEEFARVIIAVILPAVAGDMPLANSSGSFSRVVRPSGSTARVARNGRISDPRLATAAATM